MDKCFTKKIITQWDPIELFPWAPLDEYENEISLINAVLDKTDIVDDVAKGIKNIFRDKFGDVFKKDDKECLMIAKKLLKESENNCSK
jgi:hypothetical protein